MYFYLNPTKEKIPLIFPLFSKRILGSQSLFVCRNVSNTSDGEPKSKTLSLSSVKPEYVRENHTSPSEPIRLGICRLASGKLQVITSASNQGFQERGSRSWKTTNLNERRESSLMFATVSKPSSLIVFEEAENCHEDKHESSCSLHEYSKPEHSYVDHAELPLLFSLGKRNYEEALNTIGAARDAGSLCQSAAAQLKDICHHLHMEDAIWAAARPYEDRVDDIIIRKECSHSETNKHDYSFFIRASNTEKQSGSSKVNIDMPNSSAVNLPRHVPPNCNHAHPLTAHTPASWNVESSSSILSGNVDITSCNQEKFPVLQCVGDNEKKIDDPSSSDGPSKEQLSYMHYRLSEEEERQKGIKDEVEFWSCNYIVKETVSKELGKIDHVYMPRFFEQSHDYGLYADTVHFDNRIMRVSTRGLSAYKATVQSLKYLSTAYLTNSQMEVLRITMETEQHCIQARWRIKGVPLHSYILRPWGKKHKYRYFDAFSTFYVGNDGLIHSHVLDKVMPSSEGKVVAASWAVRLGIMLGLVRPPAFETDIMKAITHMKSLLGK